MSERKKRVKAESQLTVVRRCELLDVARSTAYYEAAAVSDDDLLALRLIDEIHLRLPFYERRRIRDELEEQGHWVNRKRVQRLMRQMGLRALYPKPRTSRPGQGHKIYPYLLQGLSIERPHQVWATDMCYIPMAKGFMYLVAIMAWATRRVLSWRVSNTMDWVDNVFVARLWRSVKYEDVYLHAYEVAAALRAGLARYFKFYNGQRRQGSLGRRTPDSVYFAAENLPVAA